MKLVCLFLALFTTGFAEEIFLDNQTSYPDKHSKMAIQWADSAKEVNEENQSLFYGEKINTRALQKVSGQGKIKFSVPKAAQQFRVLVWSKGANAPDYATNWIALTPDKTYTLKDDYLVPVVLMNGTGC